MERALPTRETELVALRRNAEDLAKARGQKPTTTHLLAALAGGRDDAAQLLLDRRLDAEVLLKAARVTVDDTADAIARTLQRARDLAGRAGVARSGTGTGEKTGTRAEARSVHVLFALCQETGTAAHRALVQCGTDVTRLRTSAMQLAMGFAPPRRAVSASVVAAATGRTSGIMPVAPTSRLTPATTKPSPGRIVTTMTPVAPSTQPGTGEKTGVASGKGKKANALAPSPKESPKAQKARVDRFALDPKQYPLLTQLGQNMTQLAARGELDPVVGRDGPSAVTRQTTSLPLARDCARADSNSVASRCASRSSCV